MSLIQKVKQYFKKPDRSIETSASKSETIVNNEAARLEEQKAAENRRKEADIQRYNEYLASERFREEQEKKARLARIEEERLKEQRSLEHQRAEQEPIRGINEKERRTIEIERLKQIHALNQSETYLEYLREAGRFRKDYGKNIECDICGEWEFGLFNHRGQTYCERHIPTPRHTENEHKVTAGRHGSSRSFVKR